MSWLFSQALAVEYSEGTSLAGEQFALLNVMPTPHKFWRNDKTMEFSNLSRFGLTLRLLTESHGEELLTSFRPALPASPTAWQGGEKVPMTNAGCGQQSLESFQKSNRHLCGLKTSRDLFQVAGLSRFLLTLPSSGSMRTGVCCQQPPLVTTMIERGSGFWPTPAASDWKGSPLPATAKRRSSQSTRGVRLPEEMTRRGLLPGGKHNPEFSEWLMDWPVSWTDIEPLAMDRFQEWQQRHLNCSPSGQVSDSEVTT